MFITFDHSAVLLIFKVTVEAVDKFKELSKNY